MYGDNNIIRIISLPFILEAIGVLPADWHKIIIE
jgi:hypothetical protein